MSRRCEITGVGPLVGNNVSHAHNKTKRRFLPNLQKKKVWVPELGSWVVVKATAKAFKTMDKKGLYKMLKENSLSLK